MLLNILLKIKNLRLKEAGGLIGKMRKRILI